MEEDRKGWKQIRSVKLDRKKYAKSMRKVENATKRHAHRFIVKRIDNVRLVAREITTWLVLLGLLIAGLGIQLFWSQGGYMTTAARGGGVYVEGAVGEIKSINPLFVSTNAEASVARLLFSSLYSYDTKGHLKQDLSTGVSVDETQRVYTVSLRKNAKWHDGKPVTAKDIVFTINLIKNPAVYSPLRINWLDVSVAALNETTVQFSLPAVYAAFPYALTFPIVPEHLLKEVSPSAIRENTYSQSPVGSGPFKFRRVQESDSASSHRSVHLQANQDYYAGAPKLSRFELHAYPSEEAVVKAINTGELTGASDVSISAAQDIKSRQTKITPISLDSGVYLLFNTKSSILSDSSVRKGLQLATDSVEIRKQLGGGVKPLAGPLLASQIRGTDIPPEPLVDVKRAAEVLESAGWKMSGSSRVKGEQKLEFTVVTAKKKEYETVLRTLQDQWRKIGVKLTVNSIDSSSSAASSFDQNVLQSRNFDILLYELAIGADPDVYAYWHSTSHYNFSGYSSTLADTSLVSARSRLEPDLRNAKYKQFVSQWYTDAPAIALYQPAIEYVSLKEADTVKPGMSLVSNSDRYSDVIYWTVASDVVYKTP